MLLSQRTRKSLGGVTVKHGGEIYVMFENALARYLAALAVIVPLMLADTDAQAQGRSQGRAVVMTGELEVVHIDEADGRRTRFEFMLEDDATGDLFELNFPGNPPPGLTTGKRVTVHGHAIGQDIAVR